VLVALLEGAAKMILSPLEQAASGWFVSVAGQGLPFLRIHLEVVENFSLRLEMQHELETPLANYEYARPDATFGPERVRAISNRFKYGCVRPTGP
jgi:hypothetical protein